MIPNSNFGFLDPDDTVRLAFPWNRAGEQYAPVAMTPTVGASSTARSAAAAAPTTAPGTGLAPDKRPALTLIPRATADGVTLDPFWVSFITSRGYCIYNLLPDPSATRTDVERSLVSGDWLRAATLLRSYWADCTIHSPEIRPSGATLISTNPSIHPSLVLDQITSPLALQTLQIPPVLQDGFMLLIQSALNILSNNRDLAEWVCCLAGSDALATNIGKLLDPASGTKADILWSVFCPSSEFGAYTPPTSKPVNPQIWICIQLFNNFGSYRNDAIAAERALARGDLTVWVKEAVAWAALILHELTHTFYFDWDNRDYDLNLNHLSLPNFPSGSGPRMAAVPLGSHWVLPSRRYVVGSDRTPCWLQGRGRPKSDEPGCCAGSYMVQSAFVWAILNRFPDLCGDFHGPNYGASPLWKGPCGLFYDRIVNLFGEPVC